MACHQPRRGLLIFFTSFQGSGQIVVHCAQHSHPPNPERAETRSCPRRAHSDRARSASKKDIWPFSLYLHPISLTLKRRAWLNPRTARVQRGPSEAARCASKGDQPGPPLITLTSRSSRHLRLLPDLRCGTPPRRANLSNNHATTL